MNQCFPTTTITNYADSISSNLLDRHRDGNCSCQDPGDSLR